MGYPTFKDRESIRLNVATEAATSRAGVLAVFEEVGVACCQACGWRTPPMFRDPYKCLEIHHVLPRVRGGGDQFDNLVLLCGSCHRVAHQRWGRRDSGLTKPYYLRTLTAIVSEGR